MLLKHPLKLDPAWLATFIGCSHVLGFLVVNAHVGRFRPLEYELLEARYLAAALLFIAITGPPVVILMVFARIRQPLRGARAAWPPWRLWGWRALAAAVAGIVVFLLWDFVMGTVEIRPHLAWTRDGVVYFLGIFLICFLRELFAMAREREPPAPEHLRHLDLDGFTTNMMFALTATLLVPLFATTVFPNLEPAWGGGGAWVARVVPEAGALPADVAARLSPDVVILEADDDYLTLLLCPATPGGALEPAVVARSRFTLVSVSGVIAASQLQARCAGRQGALPPAPAQPAGPSRPGATRQTP